MFCFVSIVSSCLHVTECCPRLPLVCFLLLRVIFHVLFSLAPVSTWASIFLIRVVQPVLPCSHFVVESIVLVFCWVRRLTPLMLVTLFPGFELLSDAGTVLAPRTYLNQVCPRTFRVLTCRCQLLRAIPCWPLFPGPLPLFFGGSFRTCPPPRSLCFFVRPSLTVVLVRVPAACSGLTPRRLWSLLVFCSPSPHRACCLCWWAGLVRPVAAFPGLSAGVLNLSLGAFTVHVSSVCFSVRARCPC